MVTAHELTEHTHARNGTVPTGPVSDAGWDLVSDLVAFHLTGVRAFFDDLDRDSGADADAYRRAIARSRILRAFGDRPVLRPGGGHSAPVCGAVGPVPGRPGTRPGAAAPGGDSRGAVASSVGRI